MGTSQEQALVFVHGVGGRVATDRWLPPLSSTMAHLGHSRPEKSAVRIVSVGYQGSLLDPSDDKPPRETWSAQEHGGSAWVDFELGRESAAHLVERYRAKPPLLHLGELGGTTEMLAGSVEGLVGRLRDEARRFRTDGRSRASVGHSVVRQLPASGRAVVIAHSLGSVVMLDLLRRLPPDLVVDRLITIGSPLSMGGLWPFVRTKEHFPHDRVRSWVNVFDSRDPVTGGQGVARLYPEALDVDVHVGSWGRLVGNHATETYLSLPLVGALVGDALYDGRAGRPSTGDVPDRRRGAAWNPFLLAAAYARQLSVTCDPGKHRWRRRFDAARQVSVARLLESVADHAAELDSSDARPVPSDADFLDHASSLIEGTWSDEELLPLVTGLLLTSPVRPFRFDLDDDHEREALVGLLNRVRRRGSDVSDQRYAEAVTRALDEAKKALGGDSSLRGWLLVGGAVVLAATGVGVAAAAPAGLAGAALLTSTLASFGPGGMVGGMVTIAAASGAGSALVGAGIAAPDAQSAAEGRALAGFAESLAQQSPDRSSVAVRGMLAVLVTQQTLHMPSTADQVRRILTQAQTTVVNEENLHRRLKSRELAEWEARRKVLDRALDFLGRTFPAPAVGLARKALTDGGGELRLSERERRALQGAERRALPPGSP